MDARPSGRGDRRSLQLQLQFCVWKAARFAERGQTTLWEQKPETIDQFVELLRGGGEAQVTSIGREPAGMILFFQLGSVIDSNEGACDPRYEPYALGSLMHYWMACEAVRGGPRVYLGMGPNGYLQRFGSTTVRATRQPVFRSRQARLSSLGEAATVNRRRLRRAAHTYYWKARHAAGRVARAVSARRGAQDGS